MRRLHDAPFALSSDGSLLLGMTHTDGLLTPEAVLARALKSGSRVFIGIALTSAETRGVVTLASDTLDEAASYVAGARRWGGVR